MVCKEETVEVKEDITSLEVEYYEDLDDSMANYGGFSGESEMFDTDNKENMENVKNDLDIKDVKIDIEIKDEQKEEWLEGEAEQHFQEIIESMGITKWQAYKSPFDDFWLEKFVRNVRTAVRTNFMPKEGGASLLGIEARLLEYPKYAKKRLTRPLPLLVQHMVSKWGIVTKEEYTGKGRSDKEFWREMFAKNVLHAVHKDLLSPAGAAFLFGVSLETLDYQLGKAYRKRSRKAIEDVTEYQVKTRDSEPLPDNWWLSLEVEDLSGLSDMDEDIVRKGRIIRHWFLFLNFSQFGKTSKFNPYKASMQEVAQFFYFMKLKDLFSEINRPGNILASLSIYLPELAETSVVELLNSNPLKYSVRYFKGIIIKGVKHLTVTASPYDSTWSAFVKFCKELGEKSFIQVDPFLAKPELILDFLIPKFVTRKMRVAEALSKPFFRPAHNFCTENLDRILL